MTGKSPFQSLDVVIQSLNFVRNCEFWVLVCHLRYQFLMILVQNLWYIQQQKHLKSNVLAITCHFSIKKSLNNA